MILKFKEELYIMGNMKLRSVGRPRIELTEEFKNVWRLWKLGKFETTVQAIKESKTSKSTFYRFNKILEQQEVQR